MVLAWPRNEISRFPWKNLLAEAVQVVVYIDLPTYVRISLINILGIFLVEELSGNLVGSRARHRFFLLILYLGMWIV